MSVFRISVGVFATLVLFHIPTVSAAEPDPVAQNPASPWYALDKPPGWHFDVGIGIESEPTYAGSANRDEEPDLLARAIYRTERGTRYFITLGEIGAIFSLRPETQLSAFLEYEEGRDADDEPALVGLDSIDATVEGQIMLAQRFGNASVFAILQPDLLGDANKGLVWFVGAGYDTFVADNRVRLSSRIDVSGADSEYMATEFGISDQEATRTRFDAFEPGSGLKSATLGFSAEYFFSERLSILSTIEAEHYLGDAAKSPLVTDGGRRTNLEASALIRFSF